MKPFYKTKLGKLYIGNCLSMLIDFKDNEAGALITDPPYSSGGQFRLDRIKKTSEKYKGRTKKQYLEFHGDNKDQRAFYKWSSWWMSECYRIIKPGAPACVFTDWRQLPITTDAFQAAGFVWRGIAVWDKTEGTRPVKGRFRNQCEYVVWGTKGASPAQGKCLPGLLRQCNSGPKKTPFSVQVGEYNRMVNTNRKRRLYLRSFHRLGNYSGSERKVGVQLDWD